ncbi:MAG: PH domain-containing protein [Bryobacteraceae bacterium]|nr:PH domain-containing protein [Bryobacteraceae bacterium]
MSGGQTVSNVVVRPSLKTIWFRYVLVLGVVLCFAALYWRYLSGDGPAWLGLLPLALFLWPLRLHLIRRFTSLHIGDGKLRYERGMLSRSTRTMELSKVQDVRVDQTLGQRLINTGTISVETAGETSRISMEDVDQPHRIAGQILEAAKIERKGLNG